MASAPRRPVGSVLPSPNHNAPWVFGRGEPFRIIATLELLAVSIGVMVLTDAAGDDSRSCQKIGRVKIGAMTDNQSNQHLTERFMTTKFPLGAVLMELALQCHRRGLVLTASWIPRLQNVPADAITNHDYHDFDKYLRVAVAFQALGFEKLHELLQLGKDFIKERHVAKSVNLKEGLANDTKRGKNQRHSLRVREPL